MGAIKDIIKELFDKDVISPYTISFYIAKDNDSVEYTYVYKPLEKEYSTIIFTFTKESPNTYIFAFSSNNQNVDNEYDTTNEGNQINIFSAMNEIIKRFTNKVNPVVVKYTTPNGENEKLSKQRIKIYNRIFIQNGYKILKQNPNSVSLIREITK
jgi:hypothetical protein